MNTQRTLSILLLVVVFLVGGLWIRKDSLVRSANPQSLTALSCALDWTPNTNHTGIYVALHEKWYEEEGIQLNILPYGSVSPDVLVSAGKADLGISSAEAIVADQAAGAPVVSVAAIIAHNTSSLAVRKDSGITRPSQLDGKIYGGYGAPFEEPVIGTIIKNDVPHGHSQFSNAEYGKENLVGGKGIFKNVTLNVDPLDAIKSKRIDFSWIFDAWQGVEAKREGLELVTFPIVQYGIPDYYTPTIITSPDTLQKKKDLLRKFMKATARGYEYARAHAKESAQMLIDATPPETFPDTGLVFDSQEYLSPRYADPGTQWGVQTKESWHDYPAFMLEKKAVFDASGKPVSVIDFDRLYSNELFQ